MKGFKKKLDIKVCISCGRPFQWRKKWEKDWQKVKYCSNKCKKNKMIAIITLIIIIALGLIYYLVLRK